MAPCGGVALAVVAVVAACCCCCCCVVVLLLLLYCCCSVSWMFVWVQGGFTSYDVFLAGDINMLAVHRNLISLLITSYLDYELLIVERATFKQRTSCRLLPSH